MKRLKQYTNEVDVFSLSNDLLLKKIEKLPLPYTGNKKKLIYQISEALKNHNVQFKTVLDAFSGSGTVSLLFKLLGKSVLSNDLLTSSYINSVAFVENSSIKLSDDEKEFLLNNQNPNKGSFVEDNYLGTQFRQNGKKCRFNKFTLRECRHLDNFRANIDELCGIHKQSIGLAANTSIIMRLPFGNVDQSSDIMLHRQKQEKNYGEDSSKHDRRIGIYYDDDLNLNFGKWFKKYVNDFTSGILTDSSVDSANKIKRASFLANIQQHVLRDCMVQGRFHHGQALAEIDVRLKHQKNQLKSSWGNQGSTEMDFFTQAGVDWSDGKPGQGMKWWNFANLDFPGNCLATNMDVVDLLKMVDGLDCVYFDPPYGGSSSDYATIYRFLEEYVYSDYLENLPHLQNKSNRFISKRKYEAHFIEMLDAAKHIPIWLFSYNGDSSWKDVDYICNIIRQYKTSVEPVVLDDNYRYLLRKKQGRLNKSAEYLIIGR